MKTSPKEIFAEYQAAELFKNSVGDKGITEQNRINERFYKGDQWRGARAGTERPLVRHNVIKRIGDFKMSQIMKGSRKIKYTADGVSCTITDTLSVGKLKNQILDNNDFVFNAETDSNEINFITDALSNCRELCAERLNLEALLAKALKDAYISGTGIIYSFWESNSKNDKGDIGCEVLSVDNVFFADPYTKDVNEQPYIIISGYYSADDVSRKAMNYGAKGQEIAKIEKDSVDGKVLVLTKFYKEYMKNGKPKILCTSVTENAVVREPFDTRLSSYPFAVFSFEDRNDIIYGDSEITYLIPNQIAINRMITANVWSSMSSGMPIMVVNGDTVTGDITNDPGQIIKVYGSNEDVKGAVNFVSPPDFSAAFCENINNLIENTLTQSGATAAVLGDELLNNATVLASMKDTAVMSLDTLRCRYNAFLKQIALIWADFFIGCYEERKLKIADENGIWYIPFNSKRYKDLSLAAEITVNDSEILGSREKAEMLINLYDKGIIDKVNLIKRLPEEVLPNAENLLETEVKS